MQHWLGVLVWYPETNTELTPSKKGQKKKQMDFFSPSINQFSGANLLLAYKSAPMEIEILKA